MSQPVAAILVAAGQSRRFGGDKLWVDLWGRPAWRWSLDSLLSVPDMNLVALVAPREAMDAFRAALPPDATERVRIVAGGMERTDSVVAGIAALTAAGVSEDTPVLVHDAARPAATVELMVRVVAAVRAGTGAVPLVPVADSLKVLDGAGAVQGVVDRDAVHAAQTPQGATLRQLRAAMEETHAWGRPVTDEASAMTSGGIPVRSVDGEPMNRKITELGDEAMLRAILAGWSAPVSAPAVEEGMRAGIGFDAHRLQEGRELHLAGLAFPGETGLAGHSDGDAALHAVIDALLGAAALGDVGALFPPEDERFRDADSGELLRMAVTRLADAGWRPAGLDLAIVARRPPIAARREEIVARLADLIGLASDAISVKGTTSDGLGFAGSEGIAAFAVATVARA
ncbi:MAG TPA: 2-C-methyl-D-erythritol 2,4-cyclodiphosphate synthase [Candidatus Limnocylindria bacterium]|jgi:2-C-methyl-D-erythritol 4-phosphate cytidylyltransferase/2-C-methyl-D-erythritol 2,4-cyclodiphosphate synthase|nr:2-C-methyl-D-erythritol 2,4-cyclodiphosphate synthase [Candidatus Limnocylindria bacterium]